ncbi:MAG TPA: hypothetical protein VEX86_16220 [Longimicrobium sp.]|nr:hypothetical protein [Longimicrobium sp.]
MMSFALSHTDWIEHPGLALLFASIAAALVIVFTRLYAAANPPETRDAIKRGEAKPVWTRGMWLSILGAFVSLGLVLAC